MRGGGVPPERIHVGHLRVLPLHIRRGGGHRLHLGGHLLRGDGPVPGGPGGERPGRHDGPALQGPAGEDRPTCVPVPVRGHHGWRRDRQ